MTRDFVGYGPEPPHPQWPGDARDADRCHAAADIVIAERDQHEPQHALVNPAG